MSPGLGWGERCDLQGLYPTAPRRPLIAVHVLEEKPSRWLVEEIVESCRFASSMGLGFRAVNVADPRLQAELSRRGVPWSWDYVEVLGGKCIILDLRAEGRLEPWEASTVEVIVVGGIMGDHPPRGRTYLLATQYYTVCAGRSLGPVQLSIDGAVKVASLIAGGANLDEIEVVEGLTIEVETPLGNVEVELPFGYPRYKGRLLKPGFLEDLLSRGILWDEETMLEPH